MSVDAKTEETEIGTAIGADSALGPVHGLWSGGGAPQTAADPPRHAGDDRAQYPLDLPAPSFQKRRRPSESALS